MRSPVNLVAEHSAFSIASFQSEAKNFDMVCLSTILVVSVSSRERRRRTVGRRGARWSALARLRRTLRGPAAIVSEDRIAVQKVVVDGETVYRIRVVDLSSADACALCARLKDDGGDCFVAR
jgi:hypothetical protein